MSKEKAQALAASLWDEELWNQVAGTREEISAAEWIEAVKKAEAAAEAAPGARFKWYAKVKRIGKGAFGVVDLVKGKDKRLYVMKIVLRTGPKVSASGQVREAVNEANILKTLNHPNIVEFKEVFNEGRHICIVMAYCESGDLKQRIKKAQKSGKYFKQNLVMDWFVQMAQGLHYLHAQHIMHRDLKPQNIFLTKNNRIVKIGDFGVTQKVDWTLHEAQTMVGTPYYMSPELATNAPYTQKSDVWCGALFVRWRLLLRCCAVVLVVTAVTALEAAAFAFRVTLVLCGYERHRRVSASSSSSSSSSLCGVVCRLSPRGRRRRRRRHCRRPSDLMFSSLTTRVACADWCACVCVRACVCVCVGVCVYVCDACSVLRGCWLVGRSVASSARCAPPKCRSQPRASQNSCRRSRAPTRSRSRTRTGRRWGASSRGCSPRTPPTGR